MIEIACEDCKTPFQPGRKTQRFCSKPCKIRWHMRNWRAKNPEREKEIQTKSRTPRREKINAKIREWHHANKTKQNAKRRQHHAEHRDEANMKREARYHATQKETPWNKLLMTAKQRAKNKEVSFSLTPQWASERWTGRCELTDIPFRIVRPFGGFFSPSIDRIIPSRGYEPDNCRFILFAVNALKGSETDENMMIVVSALYNQKDYQEFPPNPYTHAPELDLALMKL